MFIFCFFALMTPTLRENINSLLRIIEAGNIVAGKNIDGWNYGGFSKNPPTSTCLFFICNFTFRKFWKSAKFYLPYFKVSLNFPSTFQICSLFQCTNVNLNVFKATITQIPCKVHNISVDMTGYYWSIHSSMRPFEPTYFIFSKKPTLYSFILSLWVHVECFNVRRDR